MHIDTNDCITMEQSINIVKWLKVLELNANLSKSFKTNQKTRFHFIVSYIMTMNVVTSNLIQINTDQWFAVQYRQMNAYKQKWLHYNETECK